MIKQELDRIKERISNKDFLENKGLSNEVGIHVFCYKAEDELIVQDYIRRLKSEVNTPYRIIECDLYEVFLSLLEDKRILKSVAGLEEKRGKKYLLDQLQKIDGVRIPELRSATTVAAGESVVTAIDARCVPAAGYFEMGDIKLNMKVYNG